MATEGKTEARRILIVEDEMLVAMHLEDVLVEMGHRVVALASRLDKAIALANEGDIDLAFLDVNVAGEPSFPVADILRGRGIPFIFATGYGEQGLTDGYRLEVTLRKPFEPQALEQAIDRALTESR